MENRSQVLVKLDRALEKLGEVQPKNAPSANRLKEGKEKVRAARAEVASESDSEPAPPEPEPSLPPTPLLDGWGARMEGKVYGTKPDGSLYMDAPWDADTQHLFEQHAGRAVTRIHWGQSWLKMDVPALNFVKERNAHSLVTLPLPVDRINAGLEDAAIDVWARACAGWGFDIMVRPGWEMNGDWYSSAKITDGWGQHPHYIEAWKRFVTRVRAIAPNVKFCWCVNILGGTAAVDPAPFFPGESYIDALGIDGYNFGGTHWVKPLTVFKPTYDRLLVLAPYKPIFVCETGSAETGGNKAEWITELFTKALPELPHIRELYWFNSNMVENGVKREWPIETSSAAQSAFVAAVQRI